MAKLRRSIELVAHTLWHPLAASSTRNSLLIDLQMPHLHCLNDTATVFLMMTLCTTRTIKAATGTRVMPSPPTNKIHFYK